MHTTRHVNLQGCLGLHVYTGGWMDHLRVSTSNIWNPSSSTQNHNRKKDHSQYPLLKIKLLLVSKLNPSVTDKWEKKGSLSSFHVVILGLEVSGALANRAAILYLGCSLAVEPVWKADACRKTVCRATLRAKVVNFCPDSLEPVQAMQDYLSNSLKTAAGMGYMECNLQWQGAVIWLDDCIVTQDL